MVEGIWEISLSSSQFCWKVPLEKIFLGSSHHGSAEMNLTSIHEDAVLIPGLTQWVKDPGLL